MQLSAAAVTSIRRRLLAWYESHARDLPWRRASDPYAVWVSEVMLQQTRVSVVIGYFERWMKLFPSVGHLARASEDDVLHAWQGLGYYSRARRIREGARFVCDNYGGELPGDVERLLAIPGIGPYSAGAIASIAHGTRAPIVDGNVVRVLCRLFGLRGDPAKAALARTLWQLAGELVPEDRPADFNQALMELGAPVCTPRRAQCFGCPLSKTCVAFHEGLVEQLPETAPRPEPTRVETEAALVQKNGRWLVHRLPADAARWAGMWSFPTLERSAGERAGATAERAVRELCGLEVSSGREVTRIEHQVTRFRIETVAFLCDASRRLSVVGGRDVEVAWRRPDELGALAMPVAQRKLARLVTGGPTGKTALNKSP